jgi:hypothetical protein
MILDGIPLPGDPLLADFPPTLFDRVAGFIVLYMALLTRISYRLPRPWFVKALRTLFPFMEDFDRE